MLSDVRTRKVFVQVLIVLMMVVTMVGQANSASAASSNAKYEYYVTAIPKMWSRGPVEGCCSWAAAQMWMPDSNG